MSNQADEWATIVKDSNGNTLRDGDSNIRTTSAEDEVEVRDGKGTFVLKTCFLKKS